jgi:dTDP-4-dehydrorhamnose reductase
MTAVGSTTWCGFARRPLYSVLDNKKLNMRLDIRLAHWEEGLKEALGR